jgi:hypothetical protein
MFVDNSIAEKRIEAAGGQTYIPPTPPPPPGKTDAAQPAPGVEAPPPIETPETGSPGLTTPAEVYNPGNLLEEAESYHPAVQTQIQMELARGVHPQEVRQKAQQAEFDVQNTNNQSGPIMDNVSVFTSFVLESDVERRINKTS